MNYKVIAASLVLFLVGCEAKVEIKQDDSTAGTQQDNPAVRKVPLDQIDAYLTKRGLTEYSPIKDLQPAWKEMFAGEIPDCEYLTTGTDFNGYRFTRMAVMNCKSLETMTERLESKACLIQEKNLSCFKENGRLTNELWTPTKQSEEYKEIVKNNRERRSKEDEWKKRTDLFSELVIRN
jgi:hypothetical protein